MTNHFNSFQTPCNSASELDCWYCCCVSMTLCITHTNTYAYIPSWPLKTLFKNTTNTKPLLEKHSVGLISHMCSSAIITLSIVTLTSFHDPRWTICFTSNRTVDCGEQMGLWSLSCNTVDHIRAIKQYIKIPSLWSYHTCHWSISSYICQAMRILIAQLITASDWCDRWIYGSCKCWGRSRQMHDSIADSYSRLMACFISANPGGLV